MADTSARAMFTLRCETASAVVAINELAIMVRGLEGASPEIIDRLFAAVAREPLIVVECERDRIVIKPAPCWPAVMAELRALRASR